MNNAELYNHLAHEKGIDQSSMFMKKLRHKIESERKNRVKEKSKQFSIYSKKSPVE